MENDPALFEVCNVEIPIGDDNVKRSRGVAQAKS